MFITIIIFVFVLGLLVFVHELGHFITAKRMGVRVDEFGFGFPPRIFGIKRGDTMYSLNWVPLGGFVKIKGETGEDKKSKDSFASKTAWRRISILSAGVGMNFFLAFVLLSFGFLIGIPQEITESDINNYDIRDEKIIIIEVAEKSPANSAGIKIGDELIMINGQTFKTQELVSEFISKNSKEELKITIARGIDEQTHLMKPEMIEGSDHPVLGIGMIKAGLVKYNFFESIYRGAKATITVTILIFLAFFNLFYGLFSGSGLTDQISGPVGIAVLTGQVAQLGIPYLINFTAMLSINLAILNILPFPALDGGRILFVVIEKIKGKPVNEKIEALFHNMGFSLLILLVIFITYKDVARYGGKIWQGITNLFV